MKIFTQKNIAHRRLILSAVIMWLTLGQSTTANAQTTSPANGSTANGADAKSEAAGGDQQLAAQLRELQIKMAKLEAAMKKKGGMKMGSSMKGGKMMGKGMGKGSMSGKGKSGMGMMGGKKKMSGNKITGGKKKVPGMGMQGKGMAGKGMGGMAMMGKMKGMGKMQMPSGLPGFAGASHIYHIGATSFFLDHSQHITLTPQQQTKLNKIKEKTMLAQATADRWIAEAEQELWVATSSEAPNAPKIEAKIREIQKLNGDKRIAYIRAVGEAARILTDEQRKTLVGSLPASHGSEFRFLTINCPERSTMRTHENPIHERWTQQAWTGEGWIREQWTWEMGTEEMETQERRTQKKTQSSTRLSLNDLNRNTQDSNGDTQLTQSPSKSKATSKVQPQSKAPSQSKAKLVEFCCHAPEAAKVLLTGTFNDWETNAAVMTKDSRGDWHARLDLKPGRYEFKFVVDGHWCCDPNCHASGECPNCVPNEFGTMNRFIDVA
ncbi:MAG: hypothetical protein GXP29_02770 [Planctomycetes bacterium]|nr:hypothetical protein [Planctomycetota bacterium]